LTDADTHAPTPVAGAAYGVRFTGLEASPTLALFEAEEWYPVEVSLTTPRDPALDGALIDPTLDRGGREALLVEGLVLESEPRPRGLSVAVRIDRPRRKVQVSSVDPLDADSLAHPYLGLPAALFAHWSGKESLHAAAAVVEGRAWGLVGNSEHGKSTLAGALFAAGHTVLVDDVLVTDGTDAFAGPRCIDLRDGVGARLGLTLPTQRARGDTRDRVQLPPMQACVPLGGFVHLAWAEPGDGPTMVKLAAKERLKRLHDARRLTFLRAHGELMLDLAALPAWELRRPFDWSNAGEGTKLLLETLAKAVVA